MSSKVFALYDFEGDVSTGELSFTAGETIIITNKNVDEGWWEGRKADGTVGLFPQAYVQVHSEEQGQDQDPFAQVHNEEQSQDQDPFAQQSQSDGQSQNQDPFGQLNADFSSQASQDPFGNVDPFANQDPFQQSDSGGNDIFGGMSPPAASSQFSTNSGGDDIFGGMSQTPASSPLSANSGGNDLFGGMPPTTSPISDPDAFSGMFDAQSPAPSGDQDPDYIDMNVGDWPEAADPTTTPATSVPMSPSSPNNSVPPTPAARSQSVSSDTTTPAATVKRSSTMRSSKLAKNLLSSFTKTAGSSFVLGEATKANLGNAKQCRIVFSADGPMWENSPKIFSCTISNPTMETKYKIKNFIAYEVKASCSKRSVARRYKQFDWLYEQLARKFGVTISIPPLPDKQITGRYEDNFVEGRRAQLETWLGRLGLHPIVSQSSVLLHFLTPQGQQKDWKAGKRKAEKDDIIGGEFLNTIDVPLQHLDLLLAEQTYETHLKFTRNMDEACKQLFNIGREQAMRNTGLYAKDNERFGQSLALLSEAFALDEREVSQPLTQALKHTGKCFEAIGELYAEQPKCDWHPLLTGVNEYKAVLSTFPGILSNQKSAMDKYKEIRRLQGEGKVTYDEMRNASTRTEKLSYAVQAEVNHFQHYRVGDFAGYMKGFLEQQIAFHQEVMTKLQEALADYSEMVE